MPHFYSLILDKKLFHSFIYLFLTLLSFRNLIKKLLVCKYKSKFKQSKFSSHTKHHSYGKSCFNDMIKWIFFFIPIQKDVYLYLLLPQCTLFYLFLFSGANYSLCTLGFVYHHLFAISEVMAFLGVKNL